MFPPGMVGSGVKGSHTWFTGRKKWLCPEKFSHLPMVTQLGGSRASLKVKSV